MPTRIPVATEPSLAMLVLSYGISATHPPHDFPLLTNTKALSGQGFDRLLRVLREFSNDTRVADAPNVQRAILPAKRMPLRAVTRITAPLVKARYSLLGMGPCRIRLRFLILAGSIQNNYA